LGLLQDPLAALDQAKWYIDNTNIEKFPGAFEIASGNLCRQTIEQILFILCHFSSMPSKKYLNKDRTLKTPWHMLNELGKAIPNTRKTYFQLARERGPRIKKFASRPRTLNKWRKILNESSHFTLKHRKLNCDALNEYIYYANSLFDEKDKHLIMIALNELFSSGQFRAVLMSDKENTPGILMQSVVDIKNIERTSEGGVTLIGPSQSFHVVSSTDIPRGRWPKVPVLVQNSVGVSLCTQFIKKDKTPINFDNSGTLLNCFTSTPEETIRLVKHLRKIGFSVELGSGVGPV
jgi:hypothetical protein